MKIATKYELKTLTWIIYKITCLINGKSYIGQTYKTFNKRYSLGKWWIYSDSEYLINSFLKYGKDNFTIEILEHDINNIDELNAIERYYIYYLNTLSPNGFNLKEGGDNRGKMHEETKAKISKVNNRNYHLVNYLGEEFKIRGLKKFCKDNNLSYTSMSNMVNKQVTSSCGYALYGTDINKIENPNKLYKIHNLKTNELLEINNCAEFCRKMNLNKTGFSHMIMGLCGTFKNWTIFGRKIVTKIKKKQPVSLINESGEIVCADSAFEIAKKLNIKPSGVYRLKSGRFKTYKGWRILGKDINYSPRGSKYTKIVIQNLKTNETKELSSVLELSRFLNKHRSVINNWINKKETYIKDWIIIETKRL